MKGFWTFFLLPLIGVAQFAPPAGQAGSTAMFKDSSAFINWATSCRVTRGLQDISNASSGFPTVGDSSSSAGIADNSVVSLGDGGYAICTFQYPLTDGAGADFAIFENAFSDDYLEFGFVEVSSDGINFFRFPATCNIQDTAQTGAFGTSDPTFVNNLAGKYRATYGTPFDLQELYGTAGLNINNVTHVKIIDAIGSVNSAYATYDQNNHKINDPWPTPFASSGFDLDAVGVVHDITNSVRSKDVPQFRVFPNPSKCNSEVAIECSSNVDSFFVTDIEGQNANMNYDRISNRVKLYVTNAKPGVYFIHATTSKKTVVEKLIITQ